jgi:hypothetical protein
MTVSIGPLQAQEEPAFCQLFQRVFSAGITPELRDWKYAQGPRLGSVSLVARHESGALVGHVGALVFPGVCQGQAMPMAQVCDVMVEAGARGGLDASGTYGRLMQALQAELAHRHPGVFAYGFAGIRPYKLGARMGLYRAVQECRMGFWEGPTPPWCWGWAAQPVAWGHPAFGQLWARWGDCGEAPRVQRSPAYLHWRYATHPQHRYQPWLLRRWGQAKGWVITREMPQGEHCLVDSLLPQGMGAALASRSVSQGLAAHRPSQAAPAPPPRLCSWDLSTEASARLEPIMGCEVWVSGWHSDRVRPRFQPGDTDVF